MKGGALGDMKNFPEIFFKMRFLNSVTVPRNVKGEGGFCNFSRTIVLQNIETNEGVTLWCNPKGFKKSHCAKKSGATWGFLVWFRGSGRLFCFSFRFGRAFEVRVVEVRSC